jgi:colanic acid biosynthesis glycosyl transferase WcaI
VVVISPDFRAAAAALAPTVSDRIEVVQNWAPLDDVIPRPKVNPWSRRHGIADRKVVLYSGTPGHKHDLRLLLETAERLRGRPEVRVVVVSEGARRRLVGKRGARPRSSQPGGFPVPTVQHPVRRSRQCGHSSGDARERRRSLLGSSKILSYMCAGKPIVLLAPRQNLSSTIIRNSNAGLCHEPIEGQAFKDSIVRLLEDRRLVERAWAECPQLCRSQLCHCPDCRWLLEYPTVGSQCVATPIRGVWRGKGAARRCTDSLKTDGRRSVLAFR